MTVRHATPPIAESDISAAIVRAYHATLLDRLCGDAIVVGAGPSGLVAAADLARAGYKVTVLEKRLSTGGGIWGGAMGMNAVVVDEDAAAICQDAGAPCEPDESGLYRVDAVALAAALTLAAVRAGAVVLNLLTVEDLCLRNGRVRGVVVNRTGLLESLPIDPLMLQASAVLDATGHDAALVRMLRRRGMLPAGAAADGEAPMDAAAGERFVVERAGSILPGLWVCGMAVCAAWGGPRMGPIFAGMIRSGRRAAERIHAALADPTGQP